MIRRVKAEDILPVISLSYESLSERYDPVVFSTFFESFPQGFLVAVNKQQIIGFIVAIPIDISTLKIVLFSVKQKFRNQMVGSSLLTSLIEKMKNFDIRGIELEVKTSNTSAISFYEKHGFKKIKYVEKFYQNNEGAFMMRKSLKF